MSSKLANVGTSIFAIMSKMANDYNAINLSQGFPDFNCSSELIHLVNKYMRDGFNQYAPMEGVMKLREKIAEKTEFLYQAKYNPANEITITAGATQALFTAITAFVNEGDEVIVFEPAYDSYVPAIKLNGGQPVFVQLKYPDFHIDWDEVQKMITSRTRMIIINSPHNPTGSVVSDEDMKMLQKITQGSNIIILSDEVYEHIIFDNIEHLSITKYPKLAERSLAISSFGKTFHTTGWKLGYCVAPERLMKEFRKIHQFVVFAANTPIQLAIAEFLDNKNEYLELNNFYQKKRDYFIKLLKNSRFEILPSNGTYFQLLGYKDITDEKDTKFAERLTKEIGIASIPISVFYRENLDNKVLRFCFAKSNETMERAAEKLCRI
ncbi:MAG: methionine aminotransferase [Bacteroidetes bacterium]|jgi:methionine transaminase|nr:methionine aminotransferase [Bacteroidota bacterium]MBT6684911.1 methionine aminotransferase [Bacteroidota bacterium]MBT7145216.1 methionine aminotransferase [Bacteroidota bacterium]MBT7492988.1 methionine aminotransferase [Bacteroidota bacterium]